MVAEHLAHRVFEAQAVKAPDSVAVVWSEGELTYREVDEQSNRLAHLLVARGVTAERLVAVSMEPSPLLMVAMLAIWKAGGAYAPIDPSLPSDAAASHVSAAGLTLLIRNGPVPVDAVGLETIDLRGLDLSEQPTTSPQAAVAPGHLAYCIFTSGSTGRPKPVVVAHASFVSHAAALSEQLDLRATDRVLQSTAMAFDAALEEILPAWTVGGAVVIPDEARFTSRELTELINRLAVTMVSLPSAYWHQWVDDLTAGRLKLPTTLRVVFIGGDKILVDKLAAWYEVPGAERIKWVSDYGPTETTISVALHHPSRDGLRGSASPGHAVVPIGRPFARAAIYILDGDLRPVPDGVPGDLWVGGPPLARGYHASPGKTADRFRPDPYGVPGSRMYHTGDRAARMEDGLLVFYGRSDRQVKVRGQRIEIGHVESAIYALPGVREVAVVVFEDPDFGTSLAAYIEATSETTEATIRSELRNRVAEAMVPRTIAILDKIPRSPLNGKVALSELPASAAHVRTEPLSGTEMTTLEKVIAALMGEVLETRPERRDTDFFSAGGDSLRGMQLLNMVAEVTGVELTFTQLRRAPHPAGIADLVANEHALRAPSTPSLTVQAATDRRPASRGQQALWFLEQLHRAAPVYSVPVAYRITGSLDVDRLDAALTEIVARHEALRTVLTMEGGAIWQKIDPPRPVRSERLVVADLSAARRRVEQAATVPFDLDTGPLLRSTVVQIDGDRASSLWLLNVHHAVFDAWSLGVLWRELIDLYSGRTPRAPHAQFGDFTAWQQEWLESDEAQVQRAFWRERLDGAGELERLRLGDLPVEGAAASAGFALPVTQDDVDAALLDRTAHELGATPFVVLLAAFAVALRQHSDGDDLVVGVPVAGRNHPGTDGIIGYLVNTLALRLHVPTRLRFRDVVRLVDASLAEALTHQELPFADAAAGTGGRGTKDAGQLFQAMFVFQSTPMDLLEGLAELEVVEEFVHTGTAKTGVTWSSRRDTAGLSGEVEFAAQQFDESSARRWRDQLLALTAALLKNPEVVIAEVQRDPVREYVSNEGEAV